MNKIKQLKIGALTYQVEYQKNPLSKDKNNLIYGEILHEKLLIRVYKKVEADHLIVTLFHEALHSMMWQLDLPDDEHTITALAFALVAFLKDNPSIVSHFLNEPTLKSIFPAEKEDVGKRLHDLGFPEQKFTEGGIVPTPPSSVSVPVPPHWGLE